MSADTAVLEQDLAQTKEYASQLSGEVERNKKEIGNLRKAVEEGAAIQAANDQLKAELAEAKKQIKTLEAGLAKADAAAAAGEKAIAAGKAVVDGLRELGAL